MWEYKVSMIDEDNLSPEYLGGYLGSWGLDGWELIEVLDNRPHTTRMFIFKRRTIDDPKREKVPVAQWAKEQVHS